MRCLLLCSLLILLPLQANDNNPRTYHLTRNYLVGEHHSYTETTAMHIESAIIEQAELTVSQRYKEEVVAVDEKGNIHLRILMSDIESKGAAQLLAVLDFKKLENVPIDIHLNPDHNVRKIICPEGLDQGQQYMCDLIKKQLTGLYSLNLLPKEPVQVGETWEVVGAHSAESMLGPLDFVMTTKGKIVSVETKGERELLKIEFTADVDGTLGMGRSGTTKSTLSGTMVVDAATGRTLHNEVKVKEHTETINELGEKTQYEINMELTRKAAPSDEIR